MVNSAQTLEEITTEIVLDVPVNMHKIKHKSFADSGGSFYDSEERFIEFLIPENWTPDNISMGFKGPIKQYYTYEQYDVLLAQRQEQKSANGRITIQLTPLTNAQKEDYSSSTDGLAQIIILDVPVHLNYDKEQTINATGDIEESNRYYVQFLVHDKYQMHPNIRNITPSFVNLFVSAEQYSQLVEKRKRQENAYGRIVIKIEPLAKQDLHKD